VMMAEIAVSAAPRNNPRTRPGAASGAIWRGSEAPGKRKREGRGSDQPRNLMSRLSPRLAEPAPWQS
jgi:hypothetical protein